MQYEKIFYLIIRFVIVFVLCSIVTYFAIERLGIKYPPCGIDDANIFFVYAKNFSEGHGFVYNIGAERVEGFTSLLWVLIVSVAFFISKTPELILLIINIIALSFVLTILTVHLDTITGAVQKFYSISFASLAFLLIAVSSPRYITWTTFALMDVGIWSALLVILTILLVRLSSARQNISISFFILLLVLARPEAILWCPVFILLGWVKILKLYDCKQALQFARIPLITYCATIAGLTAFRVWYFGYPLPNTYYAKVSPDMFYNIIQGIKYFSKYAFLSNIWVSLAIFCSGIQAFFIVLDCYKTYRLTSSISLSTNTLNRCCIIVVTWSGLIIPILNGGDHFGSHRFYQAIHPVLMLNIIFLGSQIAQTVACLPFPSSSFRTLKLLVLSSVALLFLVSKSTDWFYFKTTSGFRREFFIAQSQRKFGEFMTNFFAKLPKYPSVGVVVAGGVKYTYQGPIFDLMGINNVVMGHYPGDRKGMKNHAAFEKNVLFAFPPDIVTPAYANLEQQPFQYDPLAISQSWDNQYPLKGLYDDSRFQQLFPFARISINSPDTNRAIMGFFHQEFISYIAQNPDYKVEFAKKISRSSH